MVRSQHVAAVRAVAPVTLSPPAAFQIGGADFRALQQFAAGPRQRDQAVDHDIAAMGEFQRVVGVLLDDQHGQAVLPVQGPDRVENLPRDQGGEAERGFVQHQQARAAHQGAADRQHLLLAAGQRAAALGHALLEPRKQREDALQPAGAIGLAAVGGVGAHLQVFRNAHARENPAAFRRLGDAQPGDFVRRHVGDVLPVEFDLAGAGAGLAEDRHHQRRLAGAVGADQGDDLARLDLEVDALQRLDLAVGRAQAADREQGRCGGRGHVPLSITAMASSSSAPR